MQWASNELYEGKLVADPSVSGHLLKDICESELGPMLFIDTAGFELRESIPASDSLLEDDLSKMNEGEAKLVVKHLAELLASGLSPKDIAVITPYNAQVALIRELLTQENIQKKLEIGSVDGFQGREKEAVIISLVRSNESGTIGFLEEVRRTNVAITRARRHVCIIADSSTLERHPFYQRLFQYIEEHGELQFP